MNPWATRAWILLLALANAWIAVDFVSQVGRIEPTMVLFAAAMAGIPCAILALFVSRHRAANLVFAAGLALATLWLGWMFHGADPTNVNAGLGSLLVIVVQWGLLALCFVAYVIAWVVQRRREPVR